MSANVYSKGKIIPFTGNAFRSEAKYDDSELRYLINQVSEYVGKIPSTSTATNVIEYIDEKVAAVQKYTEEVTESKVASGSTKPAGQDAGDVWIETKQ